MRAPFGSRSHQPIGGCGEPHRLAAQPLARPVYGLARGGSLARKAARLIRSCQPESDQSDQHPSGEVEEGGSWGDGGPKEPGDGACGEVAEALDSGERAEGGAADLSFSVSGDGGVLGGLDQADADPGEDEPECEDGDRRNRKGEAEVGERKAADAECEDRQMLPRRSPRRPPGMLATVAAAL